MSAPALLLAPRVALYGGTFDPVHCGHLFAARAALEQGADGAPLDGVVFVPAHRSPHRREHESAADADRLDLVRAAIADEPRFAAWDVELERGGVSYTIDTVLLARSLRGADAPEPALVVGSDTLAGLPRWHRVDELLELVRPLVVPRRPRAEVLRQVAALAGAIAPRAHARLAAGVLEAPVPHPASATELRAAMASGRVPRGWLPERVWALVRERGLYGAPPPAGGGEPSP